MPSFRSIFTFAAAALVGFATAAPSVADNDALNTLQNAAAPVVAVERRCDGGCHSVPDVFVDLKVNIDALTTKCHDIKPVNGAVNVDAYVAVLGEVKTVIDAAVVDLKAFVGVKADVLLLQNGKLVSVDVCVSVIVQAIVSICALLKVVLSVCVNVQVVINLIAQISVSVGLLLTAVLGCLGVVIKVVLCIALKVQLALCAQVGLVSVAAFVKANLLL